MQSENRNLRDFFVAQYLITLAGGTLLLAGFLVGCSAQTSSEVLPFQDNYKTRIERAERIADDQGKQGRRRKRSVSSMRNCSDWYYPDLVVEQIGGYDWASRLRKKGYCLDPKVGEYLATKLDRDAPLSSKPLGLGARGEGDGCLEDLDCQRSLACMRYRCLVLPVARKARSERCGKDEDCAQGLMCRLHTCVTPADWESEKARY